jgi:23S rRNA pseudouridine2604 synthase
MNIDLDIPVGKWRHLTDKELNGIFKMVRYSSKTMEVQEKTISR